MGKMPGASCADDKVKRKSRHVQNHDFFHSPRQIAIFDVCRDKSRFYLSSLMTKFAHSLLNPRAKYHVLYNYMEPTQPITSQPSKPSECRYGPKKYFRLIMIRVV